MLDLLYIILILGCFAATFAFVAACARLGRDDAAAGRSPGRDPSSVARGSTEP